MTGSDVLAIRTGGRRPAQRRSAEWTACAAAVSGSGGAPAEAARATAGDSIAEVTLTLAVLLWLSDCSRSGAAPSGTADREEVRQMANRQSQGGSNRTSDQNRQGGRDFDRPREGGASMRDQYGRESSDDLRNFRGRGLESRSEGRGAGEHGYESGYDWNPAQQGADRGFGAQSFENYNERERNSSMAEHQRQGYGRPYNQFEPQESMSSYGGAQLGAFGPRQQSGPMQGGGYDYGSQSFGSPRSYGSGYGQQSQGGYGQGSSGSSGQQGQGWSGSSGYGGETGSQGTHYGMNQGMGSSQWDQSGGGFSQQGQWGGGSQGPYGGSSGMGGYGGGSPYGQSGSAEGQWGGGGYGSQSRQSSQQGYGSQQGFGGQGSSQFGQDWKYGQQQQGGGYGAQGSQGSYGQHYGQQGSSGQPYGMGGLATGSPSYGGQTSYGGGMSGSESTYGSAGGYGSQQQGRHSGRGPKGYQRSDDRIREDIGERLTAHPDIDPSDVEIDVKQGVVTLKGSVDDRRAKRMIEDALENISGVKDVHNQLRVETRSDTEVGSGRGGSSTSGSEGRGESGGKSDRNR
jgi:osmotically-inducible protein OsmY